MYLDSFIALLIVIGLIMVIFAGMRVLAGKDVIPKKPVEEVPPPPLEISEFYKQDMPGDYSALFMEFRGTRYIVLEHKQSMVLLETIRIAPPPPTD